MSKRRRAAIRLQAAYYLTSGAWPLFSRSAFEAITGKKTDWWLVEMVGLLAMANGATLASASVSETLSREALTLSILSACSFATIDICYARKGGISRVYLCDALVEMLLIAAVLL